MTAQEVSIFKFKFSLTFLVALLICLPYLKVLPLDAEAQPLYIFPMLFILLRKLLAPRWFLIFCLFLTLVTLLGFLHYELSAVFDSFIAVLCPIIIYYFVRNYDVIKLSKNILIFLYFYLLVALIQQYVPQGATEILLGWLKYFIPRLTLSPLSEFNRGISIVASEPSAMAPIIFMIISVAFFLYKNENISRKHLIFSLFISLYLGFLTQSITFYVITLYMIIGITSFYFLRLSSRTILAVLSVPLIFYIVVTSNILPERLMDFVSVAVFDSNTMIVLNELSGSRIGITFGPYCNLLNFGEYYYGLGAWSQHFLQATSCFPIDLTQTSYFITHDLQNVKPGSLPSLLLVDIGIFALPIYFIFIIFLKRSFKESKKDRNPITFGIVFASIIAIILGGFPLTIPQFWLILSIFLSKKSSNNIKLHN